MTFAGSSSIWGRFKDLPRMGALVRELSVDLYYCSSMCACTFAFCHVIFSHAVTLYPPVLQAAVRNGDQVLQALGLENRTLLGGLQALAKLSAGFLALSWMGLFLQEQSLKALAWGNRVAGRVQRRQRKGSNQQKKRSTSQQQQLTRLDANPSLKAQSPWTTTMKPPRIQ
jgi:hypothetical protein